jgi:hypothetical protein
MAVGRAMVAIVVLVLLGLDGTIIFFVHMDANMASVAALVLGGLLTLAGTIVSWFFGSSYGTERHAEALHGIAAVKLPAPPDAPSPPGGTP